LGNKYFKFALVTILILVMSFKVNITKIHAGVTQVASQHQLKDEYGLLQDFITTDPLPDSSPWSYMYQLSGADEYLPMQYDAGNYKGWRGSPGKYMHGGITKAGFNPGSAANAALIFTAPYTGQIVINESSIAVENSNSNGVNAKILKNNSQIWPQNDWQFVGYNAPVETPTITLSIRRGETIIFIVGKSEGGGGSADFANWTPSIKYVFAMKDFYYNKVIEGRYEVSFSMINFAYAHDFTPSIFAVLYDYNHALKAFDAVSRTPLYPGNIYRINSGICYDGNLLAPTIKLFIWDGINNMKPLTESINLFQETTFFHVKDFGAIPDDDLCDIQAIVSAVEAAKKEGNAIIVFDEGVYNLKVSDDMPAAINLANMNNITLAGQKNSEGKPSTTLLMNLKLENDIIGTRHVHVKNSKNIKLESLILDHYPRTNTAAEIIEVDKSSDRVVVDILPDMPHFDGMRCYSSNGWDLETKDLLPIAALTIGTNKDKFTNLWRHIPGGDGRRYEIEGINVADKVEVGQGISWHFNVTTSVGHNIDIDDCENVSVENLHIYNAITVPIMTKRNNGLTFKDIYIGPEGNSLAVAPRDAFHMPSNTGNLLMDSVYVKGCRWDIVNVREGLDAVGLISGDRKTFKCSQNFVKATKIRFWAGEAPFDMAVSSIESLGGNEYSVTLSEKLPESVVTGTYFTPNVWTLDKAVIQNCTFEGNFGTILYQSANLLLQNNVFRNNAYANLELGVVGEKEGGFARDIVIKDNQFIGTTWIHKTAAKNGAVSLFQSHPDFTTEPYNTNIIIENNLFQDVNFGKSGANIYAVKVGNAQNVILKDNKYVNIGDRLLVVGESTKDIYDYDN